MFSALRFGVTKLSSNSRKIMTELSWNTHSSRSVSYSMVHILNISPIIAHRSCSLHTRPLPYSNHSMCFGTDRPSSIGLLKNAQGTSLNAIQYSSILDMSVCMIPKEPYAPALPSIALETQSAGFKTTCEPSVRNPTQTLGLSYTGLTPLPSTHFLAVAETA